MGGVTNAIMCSYNCLELLKVIGSDSACSRTGILSKRSSSRVTKNQNKIWKYTRKQKLLILMAIDIVNAKSTSGSFVTYFTHSFMVEENETVIAYALRKRNVQITSFYFKIGR